MSANLERLHTGELYDPGDPKILAIQAKKLDLMYEFNRTRPSEGARRAGLLKQMLAEMGEGCYIEPPFYANWGGAHVHLGRGVYVNFHLTAVDDTHIYIGDYTMIGPNVTIAAASHPIRPQLRREVPLQYNLPVHIGKNCWIASNVTILPGVSIGDNSVIGAGSVVTKDIPANAVAMGVPCRVCRMIDDEDRDKENYMQLCRSISFRESPHACFENIQT